MSHDVTQWIAEIKAMREQVAEAQRDRDTALETAAKWSQLYNAEAEQRRTDAKLSQQMIDALKAEIQQLKADIALEPDDSADVSGIYQEVEKLQTVEELKRKLIEVMQERDRLIKALKAEQESHAQTRQTLTTALSDTVEVIMAKERGGNAAKQVKPTSNSETKPEPVKLPEPAKQPAQLANFKSPSLQLPPTRPAPPRL